MAVQGKDTIQELSESDAEKLDAETLLSKYEGGWGGFRGFYRRPEEVFRAENREAKVLRKEILKRLQSVTNNKEG